MNTDRKNEELKNSLIIWLKEYLDTSKKDGYVLGVSGGLDSAVCAKLLLIGKIPHKFVYMSRDKDESSIMVDVALSIYPEDSSVIDLRETINSFKNTMTEYDLLNDVITSPAYALKNNVSRIISGYLYIIAQRNNGLVLGTTNKSENFIGYFTKGGDGLTDIEPLINITKTELREFARYIGVHPRIIEKAPAADLGISKTDEDEMGYTYEQLDRCIEDFENETLRDNSIQNKIMNDHYKSEFKRHMPKSFQFKMQ